MGADLIGCHVVGPKRIRISGVRKMELQAVADVIKQMKAQPDDDDPTEKSQAVEKLLAREGYQAIFDTKGPYATALAFLKEFVQWWNKGCYPGRDVSSRKYRGKTIVFAGDMSWGNEPEGFGYETLYIAIMLGFTGLLGIE